ncbi:MAG: threonine ammonia-lyase, partial [Flavobacteriales bacterium]|nr:threonine ammonia-lyase [Flavobacteriales bacterium]
METRAYYPQLSDVQVASERIKEVITPTPLMLSVTASEEHQAQVYLKREDLQRVRSYKIRGAYNKIKSLKREELCHGVVCASAGNHAQGVAYACKTLNIKGVLFMPAPTPLQKIEQVKMFGGAYVQVILEGDTFDDALSAAKGYCEVHRSVFIPPFDDEKVIEGQATIGLELLDQADEPVDYLFLPVGGGGLAAGVSAIFKALSPSTKIIGVEPEGAPSLTEALRQGYPVKLDRIDKFVDGAAVQQVGELNFQICKEMLDDVVLVPEGKVCETILKLYNKDAMVVEPAGALALAALDAYQDELKGKNVICVISGSNNDIVRMEEIKERALLYQGLKHYFIVNFPQRAGALKEFVNEVLGPKDDITFFEFSQKHNKEFGPALVGIRIEQQ